MSDASPVGRRCPTCGATAPADGPCRPFCSVRCKNVDLGAWLLGHYRIPAAPDSDTETDVPSEPHPPSDEG